ncbi:hypothetical protein KFE25_013464 [Diacronema lutheri]|uniref:F-box domain-containing protein n=1 Tax=Diacronema lutheri TaxID=2081491 RepID=A0A8J6CER6_DIALT|nr:hypothetical protein KFE25_013464 [Diacronema lutheri]
MANKRARLADGAALEVPRDELLCTLLCDATARLDGISAQLERVSARIEGLDERVSRVEHTLAAWPPPPAAAAPVRRVAAAAPRGTSLSNLPIDQLALIAAHLDEKDELAAALSCRRLRAALVLCHSTVGAPSHGSSGLRWRTPVSSLVNSLPRLQWGVACGAPLSATLCLRAATRAWPPPRAPVGA